MQRVVDKAEPKDLSLKTRMKDLKHSLDCVALSGDIVFQIVAKIDLIF